MVTKREIRLLTRSEFPRNCCCYERPASHQLIVYYRGQNKSGIKVYARCRLCVEADAKLYKLRMPK